MIAIGLFLSVVFAACCAQYFTVNRDWRYMAVAAPAAALGLTLMLYAV